MGGLWTHANPLNAPDGAMLVADEAEILREDMVTRRRGYTDMSSNLPDFRPEQLISIGGVAYLNLDSGLWYWTGSTWLRKAGVGSVRFDIGGTANWQYYFDSALNSLFIGDESAIYRLDLTAGTFSVLTGRPGVLGNADGAANVATFNNIKSIVGDGVDSLYVSANHAIRKVTVSTGAVTTLAGLSGTSGVTNATGTAARFNFPQGLVISGSNLYVVDTSNHAIRQVTLPGAVVTTFAGLIGTPGTTDATGGAARFRSPIGAALTPVGMYVTDQGGTFGSENVRVVTVPGAVVTTAGAPGGSLHTNAIAYDSVTAACYFTDDFAGALLKITVPGNAISSVSLPTFSFGANPYGIAASSGRLFFLVTDGVGGIVYEGYTPLGTYYPILGQAILSGEGSGGRFSPFPDGVIVGPT